MSGWLAAASLAASTGSLVLHTLGLGGAARAAMQAARRQPVDLEDLQRAGWFDLASLVMAVAAIVTAGAAFRAGPTRLRMAALVLAVLALLYQFLLV